MLFNVKNRILLALAGTLIPLGVFAGVTLYVLDQTVAQVEHALVDPVGEISLSMLLEKSLRKAMNAPSHYIAHGKSYERDDFRKAETEFEKQLKVLIESPELLPEQRVLLTRVSSHWRDGKEFANRIFALKNPVGNRRAVEDMEKMYGMFEKATLLIHEVHNIAEQELIAGSARIHDLKNYIRFSIVFVFVSGIGIVVVLGLWLARSILNPVNRLEMGVRGIAEGDYTHRITDIGNDEFGGLAESFNAMAGSLESARAKLEQLSLQDGLTGVLNRRAFEKALEEEFVRVERSNKHVCVIMLDIDHFKNVNDVYGHLVGDDVLKKFAKCVSQNIRPMDKLARYGGEEFAIILPETDLANAVNGAERVRQIIEGKTCNAETGETIDITASFGVACYPGDASKTTDLVSLADKRLYYAKRAGRNQVCGAE